MRFTPPGPGGCHHRLECILNNDPISTQKVDLFGQGAWPSIEATCGGWDEAAAAWAGDDGSRSSSVATSSAQDERCVVYMRPTCVGIISSGVIKVRACGKRTGAAIVNKYPIAARRDRFRVDIQGHSCFLVSFLVSGAVGLSQGVRLKQSKSSCSRSGLRVRANRIPRSE